MAAGGSDTEETIPVPAIQGTRTFIKGSVVHQVELELSDFNFFSGGNEFRRLSYYVHRLSHATSFSNFSEDGFRNGLKGRMLGGEIEGYKDVCLVWFGAPPPERTIDSFRRIHREAVKQHFNSTLKDREAGAIISDLLNKKEKVRELNDFVNKFQSDVLSSPLFENTKSRYGNVVLTWDFRAVIEAYAGLHGIDVSPLKYRVLGTFKHKQEIEYVIIVTPPDEKLGEFSGGDYLRSLPELSNDEIPAVRLVYSNLEISLRSTGSIYHYTDYKKHYYGDWLREVQWRPRNWEHVAITFAMKDENEYLGLDTTSRDIHHYVKADGIWLARPKTKATETEYNNFIAELE